MVDAPGRAMRPVDANFVADLATEQVVAGHAERLGLDVEQRVLDGAERQRHHAAGGRPRRGEQFRVDPLVLERILADHARREAFDRRRHAGRAKTLVIFAPTDDAVFGHDLDEVVVAPTGVAGERFDASYLGCLGHDFLPGLLLSLGDNKQGSPGASIGRAGRPYTCGGNSVGRGRANTWRPFLKPISMSGSSAIALAPESVSSTMRSAGLPGAMP